MEIYQKINKDQEDYIIYPKSQLLYRTINTCLRLAEHFEYEDLIYELIDMKKSLDKGLNFDEFEKEQFRFTCGEVKTKEDILHMKTEIDKLIKMALESPLYGSHEKEYICD
jgi:hypothetical protein